jgi:hypothetical protein
MRASRRVLTVAVACLLNCGLWNMALSCSAAAQQSDEVVAERILGPHWKQLSRRAGMIFAGTVLSTTPQTATTSSRDRSVCRRHTSDRVALPDRGSDRRRRPRTGAHHSRVDGRMDDASPDEQRPAHSYLLIPTQPFRPNQPGRWPAGASRSRPEREERVENYAKAHLRA